MLKQVICTIKIRRAPRRHDNNVDFKPLVERAAAILPLSVVAADKGYDDEGNHVLVRERMHAYIQCHTATLSRCACMEDAWQVQEADEARLSKSAVQSERNKDETIFSVMKRLFGEST
ncbi:putative transposase IS4 family protein [Candidatus Nitrososphaera gargensis Ga9.2]|uniref:Putative transposase IS4 family protein n=1 Tax=Nitrososphaera gargensis (strain Ga9.2) TaxID=1237085 RepID=K0IBT0_NITGG|nr:hypothetical protein [Candidatus Nitrososphaera gargensis]AFU57015.1 putative transposase IS4 family protein [Candidatus Nitrososphaera gargensis Ga9.2]